MRDSPKRLDAARKQLADMGGSFKEFYLTMGEYDMVAVGEAPDDAVAARFALKLAAGNIGRERSRHFPNMPIARSSPRSGKRPLLGVAGPRLRARRFAMLRADGIAGIVVRPSGRRFAIHVQVPADRLVQHTLPGLRCRHSPGRSDG